MLIAAEAVRIQGVETLSNLTLPYHHGLAVSIQPILDPNLSKYRVEVSRDNGVTWVFLDDLKPYNYEMLLVPYRSAHYGLMSNVQYALRVCPVYGGGPVQANLCAGQNIRLPDAQAVAAGDIDDDGIAQTKEYNFGTDPRNPDSDYDDISDKFELAYNLDPSLTQFPELMQQAFGDSFSEGDAFGSFDTQHRTIILSNKGDRPLRIFNIQLDAGEGDDFVLSDEFRLISQIDPGNEIGINVDFLPKKASVANGTITILTDDRDHYPLQIPVKGEGKGVANLSVDFAAPALNFGQAQVGQTLMSPDIPVRNVDSDVPLNVTAYVAYTLGFLVEPRHFDIGPGDQKNIAVEFFPDWSGTYEGELVIEGENDSSFKTVHIPIRARAQGDPPKLRLELNQIFFPVTNVGAKSEKIFNIHNDGDGQLFVKWIDLGEDESTPLSSVFKPSSRQLVVPPHSNRPMRISFTPKAAQEYISQLCIVSNDAQVGVEDRCGVFRTIGTNTSLPAEASKIVLKGQGQ